MQKCVLRICHHKYMYQSLVYSGPCIVYCKFGNFRETLILAIHVKSRILDVKNSRLGCDLPISVDDRVILPFREGFIFTKLHKNKPSRKFPHLRFTGTADLTLIHN